MGGLGVLRGTGDVPMACSMVPSRQGRPGGDQILFGPAPPPSPVPVCRGTAAVPGVCWPGRQARGAPH